MGSAYYDEWSYATPGGIYHPDEPLYAPWSTLLDPNYDPDNASPPPYRYVYFNKFKFKTY